MSISPVRLAVLEANANDIDFRQIKHGVEKESLRITNAGTLAQTRHPQQLGSALTHPQITTDFSEALLEFITSPTPSIAQTLKQLEQIHRYTYANIDPEEMLWVNSMPCVLPDDDAIPVAQYGSAHIAQMKTVYRLGLGHRYGRLMQTIAGIHFNFSLPDDFWRYLRDLEPEKNGDKDLQTFRTQGYFYLIRNFRRYFWLLLYLFGASPAVCPTFVQGRKHHLKPLGNSSKTLHAQFATSLRMGDLGYQSTAQQSILINYNSLPDYLAALCQAITKPHPDYAAIGLKDAAGHYQQLNTGILQIENEFYSTVRPKRSAQRGETALRALFERGVEYLEVRCVDLNPFEPLGIDADQIRFLDTFLLYCTLADSPLADPDENRRVQENQQRIVYRGRDPELKLLNRSHERPFREWANHLLEELQPVAELLDRANGCTEFQHALRLQQEKIAEPTMTPSARVLETLIKDKLSFYEFGLAQAQTHNQYFRARPLATDLERQFAETAAKSLRDQTVIEQHDTGDFEHYLREFYAQYQCCSGCP